MDFLACSELTSDMICSVYAFGSSSFFGFAFNNRYVMVYESPTVLASRDLGSYKTFSASNWSASVVADAPEPGTLVLGLAAAAFATAVSRRKRLVRPE